MVTIFDNYAEYFLIIIAVGFLFAPVVHYLIRGWGARRHEILSSFGKGAILRYFKVFFSAEVEAIKDPKLATVSGFVLLLLPSPVLFFSAASA